MKSIENPLELMVFNRLNVCVFFSVKYCQSIVGGTFWKAQTRRTVTQNPLKFQRVYFVNLGL